MEDYYNQLHLLTEKYIDLNTQFIQGLNDDAPAEELTRIKEQVQQVMEEIEALEAAHTKDSLDKDILPLE